MVVGGDLGHGGTDCGKVSWGDEVAEDDIAVVEDGLGFCSDLLCSCSGGDRGRWAQLVKPAVDGFGLLADIGHGCEEGFGFLFFGYRL